jgi:hypothetical protein
MLDDIALSREGAVFGYIVVCRDRHPQFLYANLRSRHAAQAFTGYNSAARQGKYRIHAEIVRHITAVASDAVSALYRFTIPIRALIEQGTATRNVSIGLAHIPHVMPGSTLLLQGQLTLPGAVVVTAKENHCRLVRDFDELPWSPSGDDQNASAISPALTTALDQQIACAEAVTVSTEPLARAMREHGYNLIALPSVVDPRDWTAAATQ